MTERRNMNRGYQKLIVWQDAAGLYVLTSKIYRRFQYELRRVGSNQIASVDSMHRNIAEGYCRRILKEYLQCLNVALGSLGESVSGTHVYRRADQILEEEFEQWDALAFKLENGLLKLIKSLQHKQADGDWQDSFIIKESNTAYQCESVERRDQELED